MNFSHVSVLLNECIDALNIKKDGIYVDGTMGGAGHSLFICKNLNPNGMLIAIDQDINAINKGKEVLKDYEANVTLVHDNFLNIKSILADLGIKGVDGILLDLGVSSHQFDEGERGFSYNFDARLDMRMDISSPLTAYDIVNTYSKERLSDIIFQYSDEKWAKRIAEFIVKEREKKPIETTFELTEVIKMAVPKGARRDGPHPSKRTFQALRIEVNNEIEILKTAITDMVDVLNEGGRLAVITFHSLEDRTIKNIFRMLNNPCTCPPSFPVCVCHKEKQVELITRKPIVPSANEVEQNNRAHSAKLRVAEKVR